MIRTGLLLIFAGMNVLTFSLYGVDKRRAERGQWRIAERTLLLCTWLLGGVGAWAGMRVFHHKTRHRIFCVSAPLAAVISLALLLTAMALLS